MGVYCNAHELRRGCSHTSLDTQFGARKSRIFVQGQHENSSWNMVECNYFHSNDKMALNIGESEDGMA